MPDTRLDVIRKTVAPNDHFSGNAKVQIGKTVQSILHMYCTDIMQCAPHHQHQNPTERHVQNDKKLAATLWTELVFKLPLGYCPSFVRFAQSLCYDLPNANKERIFQEDNDEYRTMQK
jgi:hypothetical protein